MTAALNLELTETPPPPQWVAPVRRLVSFLAIVLVLCALWEGYKAVGMAIDQNAACGQTKMPICPNDKSMPHIWTIIGALFEPDNTGAWLIWALAKAALYTWREAAVGFVLGSVFGFILGAIIARFTLLERSLMPYIVASQTVPLLAIAPMIVIWGGRLGWDAWWSVSIISAYLTFFPVTINTIRGLRSPNPLAVELMRSYAASELQTLWKLRLPAALPYIFTALKVSATTSVIGAIVGELPSGIQEGIGRVLLSFSYFFTLGPEKLYAAILAAAVLGMIFTGIVALAEQLTIPQERRLSE